MDANDREVLGKSIKGAGAEIGSGLLLGLGAIGLCSLMSRCIKQESRIEFINGKNFNIEEPFQLKYQPSPKDYSLRESYDELERRVKYLENKK